MDYIAPSEGVSTELKLNGNIEKRENIVKRDKNNSIGRKSKSVWVEVSGWDNPDFLVIPPFYRQFIRSVLLSHGQVKDRIEKLALDIFDHFQSAEELRLICTLKGASVFFEHLTRCLRKISTYRALGRPAYIPEFVQLSSYDGLGRKSHMQCTYSPALLASLGSKSVLIVEDILDSGSSLKALETVLVEAGVKSCNSVALFGKRVPNWNGFIPDWVGFDIPNEFIVGFGCDVNEYFRDLDHVCCVNEAVLRERGVLC